MWKKVLGTKVALLVYGLVIGVLIATYIRGEPRYVQKFVKKAPVTLSSELTSSPQVDSEVKKIETLATEFPWFPLLNERLFIRVTDANDYKFTAVIKDGKIVATPGWTGEKPTLILENVRMAQLRRLEQILSQSELKDSDMFEVASVFLVPGLQSLYNADILFFPGDKQFLQLDNFIQVELLNKYNAKDLNGNTIEAKATVVNVDGYWMVYPGWQGEPDVRYSVDVNQMIKYYYLINYKFRELKPTDLLARKEVLDEYMQLRNDTLSYSKYK